MGTYTNLYCHLILQEENIDSKSKLLKCIDNTKRNLKAYKDDLKALIMITEPAKVFADNDSGLSPYEYMKFKFKEDIEGIKNCFYKLWIYDCYLYNWDKCHDKNGTPNGMPEFCKDDHKAFMDGDWVDTTKWTRKKYEAELREKMNGD